MSNVWADEKRWLVAAGMALAVGLKDRGLTSSQVCAFAISSEAMTLILSKMDADPDSAWSELLDVLTAIAGGGS